VAALPQTAQRYAHRVGYDLRKVLWRYRPPDRLTYFGVRLALDDWWATPRLRDALYQGYYERPEYEVLSKTLRRGDRYLELGAGIGFLTACACRMVGEENVFSYEANPELAQLASRTARANGFEPQVENAVLGRHRGTVDFFIQRDFWGSSLEEVPGARRVAVPAISFAEVLERLRPTYLTIDIEGGEIALFDDFTLPPGVRAICMETHPAAVGVEATQQLIVKLIAQGFALDLDVTHDEVAFFSREARQ
jgi:FkbM family methyltransferase